MHRGLSFVSGYQVWEWLEFRLASLSWLTPYKTKRYSRVVITRVARGTMLKRLLAKFQELLTEATKLRYVAVPVWRPWRDF